jgi:hypothetical protein
MAPFLFCNIAWMKSYRGVRGDPPKGGGSYVAEHGTGTEVHNFNDRNGVVRGYVQVTGTINLQRLGGTEEAKELRDVTVVWVAPSPLGSVIVGYYYHATVLKEKLWDSRFPEREYNVTAEPRYCHLLPIDKRTFQIPRGPGGMGQSNVWYADNQGARFIKNVSAYLKTGGTVIRTKKAARLARSSFPRNSDPLVRQKNEEKAILSVTKYFSSLGFTVKSFEKDNLGWDLQAYLANGKYLRLEVKGLSGKSIAAELTPNEFYHTQKYQDSYRICVVTNALQTPNLFVFSYTPDHHKWEDKDGRVLRIEKVIGARIFAG